MPDESREAPATPAFAEVYEAHLDYVWSSLRRLGVQAADLEDAAHDVFVVVHRRLETYDPALQIRPWLFGIAYRIAFGYRKSAARRLQEEGLEVELAPADEVLPSDALLAAEQRSLVLAALDALPPERRAVFVLHELDEIPMPVVAGTLDVNLNTAYSRLRLARRDFQRAIEQLVEKHR